MGRIFYMKHRNKIQILGWGLALALSQASGAFASAGTVTVGKGAWETSALAETSAAQTQAGQSTSGNVVTAETVRFLTARLCFRQQMELRPRQDIKQRGSSGRSCFVKRCYR